MISSTSDDEIVTGSSEVAAERFPLNSLNINPLAMGAGDALGAQMYGKQIEMRVEAGREYLLAVEGEGTVGIKITEGENGIRSVNVMNIKPNLKAIAFKAQRSGTIKAAVGGSDLNGSISYELRSADVAPATPDTVAKAAMRRWIRDLSRRDGGSFQGALVQQFQGDLVRFQRQADHGRIVTREGGDWFIMRSAPSMRIEHAGDRWLRREAGGGSPAGLVSVRRIECRWSNLDQGRSLITESWHELQVVPLSGGAFRGLIVRLCLGEHRVVVSQIDLEEGRRHLRIEVGARAPLDFSTNGLAVSPFPIRTSGSHRIEGVDDGHQATEFGNVVGLEPVWIAASIPALMVVSDTSEQFTHSGNVLENTEADVGMLLDEIEFRRRVDPVSTGRPGTPIFPTS